jgi:putative PIN family toxin of toxin-antitoxin system
VAIVRVIIDTNILVSYLLPSRNPGPIQAVVEGAINQTFRLLLPSDVLSELAQTIESKRYLAALISPEAVAALVGILAEVAEVLPPITTPIPAVTRDRDDDYLLAYALVGEADYLVTGDEDLLVLSGEEALKIVTPADFGRAFDLGHSAPA